MYVSECCPSPVYDWWIEHLRLSRSDSHLLLDGEELNDSLINACQYLLSKQFPKVVGLQDTAHGYRLGFTSRLSVQNGVQILHTGMSFNVNPQNLIIVIIIIILLLLLIIIIIIVIVFMIHR